MDQDRLGFLFGVFAGVLLFLDALLTVIVGVTTLVISGFSARLFVGSLTHLILVIVIGLLFVFFSAIAARHTYMGPNRPPSDNTLAGGVILIVLSVGTWYVLGLHLFEALAGLFGLIAGILFVLARR